MGFITRLAFKNLFRHKLRTFVSIIAISFAVMMVVFARGYIVGMIDSLFADHIQYNSGHIKIIRREYWQQERLLPLNYPVDGFKGQGVSKMISSLKKIAGVKMEIPRLKFWAMVSTDDESVTMIGWGVDPTKEKQFTNIEEKLAAGRMVKTGQLEVVMGTALLDKLNLQVGDKVTILFNTAFNAQKEVTFKIVGQLESGLKMLNEVVFYLPLDQAQRLLNMNDQSTELLLVARNRKLVNRLLPKVKNLLVRNGVADNYLALGYKETSELLPYMELAKLIYNEIYIFLVILASIIVVNTMIMIVNERSKEIGMMSALGMESKSILQLFITEGAIMGLIGSFFGALLGAVLTAYLAVRGIDFSSAVSGFSSKIMINSTIYPVSSTANTIFAFALGVLIVSVACFIPARRAARLEPNEAMRE
jgi:putative ABC transport system permease protein